MEKWLTIADYSEAQITEKKSKFIAEIYPVKDKTQVETILKQVKNKYHDAKHHCFAYRMIEEQGILERISDDGEPTGTAGFPILNIIKGKNLYNILIIVTRYFGGVLLGTGGLVRAYSKVTQLAIEQTNIIQQEVRTGNTNSNTLYTIRRV